MGGRHQNVEDPITRDQDIRKTKFDLLVFVYPPFNIKTNKLNQLPNKCHIASTTDNFKATKAYMEYPII